MSSVASNATTISFRGDDNMPVDEALDLLFRELQSNLNRTQCSIRELANSEEKNDTFLEAAEHYFAIDNYVDVLLGLFTELKSVSKQVLGTCPKEYKEEYKALCDKRKADKKHEKDNQKLSLSKLNIISE